MTRLKGRRILSQPNQGNSCNDDLSTLLRSLYTPVDFLSRYTVLAFRSCKSRNIGRVHVVREQFFIVAETVIHVTIVE